MDIAAQDGGMKNADLLQTEPVRQETRAQNQCEDDQNECFDIVNIIINGKNCGSISSLDVKEHKTEEKQLSKDFTGEINREDNPLFEEKNLNDEANFSEKQSDTVPEEKCDILRETLELTVVNKKCDVASSFESSVTKESTDVEADEAAAAKGSHQSCSSDDVMEKHIIKNQKALKSILYSTGPSDNHIQCEYNKELHHYSSTDGKSVKFAENTIFNEDKTKKKYKKERINLCNLYRGRISAADAYAKINPLFQDDSEEYPLSDEEIQQNENKSKVMNSEEITTQNHLAALNAPLYMRKLLNQPHGIESPSACVARTASDSTAISPQTQSLNEDSINIQSGLEADKPQESRQSCDVDGYDALIKKTHAKQQQRTIIKWTFIVFGSVIILALVVGLAVSL